MWNLFLKRKNDDEEDCEQFDVKKWMEEMGLNDLKEDEESTRTLHFLNLLKLFPPKKGNQSNL